VRVRNTREILKKLGKEWSGRPDLNRGPLAPKTAMASTKRYLGRKPKTWQMPSARVWKSSKNAAAYSLTDYSRENHLSGNGGYRDSVFDSPFGPSTFCEVSMKYESMQTDLKLGESSVGHAYHSGAFAYSRSNPFDTPGTNVSHGEYSGQTALQH
jgi:hypothetical protein